MHTGGGRVLLDELLRNENFGPVSAAFLDARYSPPVKKPNQLLSFFKNTILARLKAEFRLHSHLSKTQNNSETVLFFGNIPPFLKCKNKSVLYLQNCFLTRQVPLPKDSLKVTLRTWVESILLRFLAGNADEIWVQTEWMVKITSRYLPGKKIVLKPLMPALPPAPETEKKYDLIYVGSYSLHKRLSFFLEALAVLDSKLKQSISVCVVLDTEKKPDLAPNFKNISVHVFNGLNRTELAEKYSASNLFVSTSLYESFCLPLYEAHFYKNSLLLPKTGYSENLSFPATLYETDSVEDLSRKILESVRKKL